MCIRDSPKTVKRTANTVNKSKSKPVSQVKKAPKVTSKGNKLSDGTTDEKDQILSPKEAARLAAEKRQQEANEKLTKGELGKKLASEKGKSYRAQVLEDAEQKKLEKQTADLTYD